LELRFFFEEQGLYFICWALSCCTLQSFWEIVDKNNLSNTQKGFSLPSGLLSQVLQIKHRFDYWKKHELSAASAFLLNFRAFCVSVAKKNA